MKKIVLYKLGHNAEPEDRAADKPMILDILAASVADGNLILAQPPEASPQAPFVNLEHYGFVFVFDDEAKYEPKETDVDVTLDCGKSGTWIIQGAAGIGAGPDGPVILTDPACSVHVLHLKNEFVAAITTQPAVSEEVPAEVSVDEEAANPRLETSEEE